MGLTNWKAKVQLVHFRSSVTDQHVPLSERQPFEEMVRRKWTPRDPSA